MDWKTHKKQLLKDPAIVNALKETELEYTIAREIISARLEKGITQQHLAKKMKTRQSVISRVEQGTSLPSLSFLKRLADALDSTLHVHISH